jgi:hypothetical protein
MFYIQQFEAGHIANPLRVIRDSRVSWRSLEFRLYTVITTRFPKLIRLAAIVQWAFLYLSLRGSLRYIVSEMLMGRTQRVEHVRVYLQGFWLVERRVSCWPLHRLTRNSRLFLVIWRTTATSWSSCNRWFIYPGLAYAYWLAGKILYNGLEVTGWQVVDLYSFITDLDNVLFAFQSLVSAVHMWQKL